MAAQILDILWRVATWGVVGLGGLLVLWALFGDCIAGWRHARQVRRAGDGSLASRRRCPGGWRRLLWVIPIRVGCWYDMSAAVPETDGRFQCPECGRRSGERGLRASRRRWRLASVGVLIALVGLGGRYSREIYRDGWKAVPDEVLVLVPFDERVWLETGTTGSHWLIESAAQEIGVRDVDGPLSPWASEWLGRRVLRRYQRDPDYGVPQATHEALTRLAATPFSQGIDNRPFVEAVRTIAATAGVPIEIDEEALRAASIEPARRLTIPAFGMMSCEQALDWACDRARATRGWAKAEWDLREGRIVVTDEAGVYQVKRSLVIARPSREGRGGSYLQIMVASLVSPERWTINGGAVASSWALGDGLACTTSQRDLAQIARLVIAVHDAAGLTDPRAAEVRDLALRLGTAHITPVEGGDDLNTVLYRARALPGVGATVDPWGVGLHQTRLEALLERGIIREDRTSSTAEPFGTSISSGDRMALEEAGTIARALADWGSPFVHDDSSVTVGLRVGALLRRVVVYQLPALPERPVFNPGVRDQNNLSPEWSAWRARFVLLQSRYLTQVRPDQWMENGGETARVFRLGDRLIIVAPPDMQALAAPIIEQFIAEWEAELADPSR